MTQLISSHFPYLPLQVLMRGQVIRVEALVDTGFEGEITLPPDLVPPDSPAVGELRGVLADGSRVRATLHRGAIVLEGLGTLIVLVAELGDEPLVGVGVLQHFSVTLDHGRQVIVEP